MRAGRWRRRPRRQPRSRIAPTAARTSGETCRSRGSPMRSRRRESQMAGDAKVEALRKVPLFGGLRDRDLEQVARLVDEVDLPEGHVLMREGEVGSQAFVIASGEARI